MHDVSHSSGQDMLARIRWQCRRGMLELDLMLQPFVENNYLTLSKEEQAVFQELLKYPDQELQELLLGNTIPDNKDVANVTHQIRQAVTR